MITNYENFIKNKVCLAKTGGFEIDESEINPILKPFQKACVKWAIQGGRRALFESFGLGKSVQQLEIIRLILAKLGGGRGLIVAPLGVRQEFKRDAKMLGLEINFVRKTEEINSDGLYLTNYESVRDGKLDVDLFDVVSLDEASCLRGFGGTKTFREFMAIFAGDRKTMNERTYSKGVQYRFVATATPSPNEYIELLAYSAFLGIMDVSAAKTRFFKRDSTKADHLTIHPHKEKEFWLWVASWAMFLQSPSDLGFSDEGYDLPEKKVIFHETTVDHTQSGFNKSGQKLMFRQAAIGLSEAAKEKRDSLNDRILKMKEIIAENPDDSFLIWHDLESERIAIESAIPSYGYKYWFEAKDGNSDALAIYERHYSAYQYADGRERKLFVGPGEKLVLMNHTRDSLFAWRKFIDDSGQTGVNCAVFRNESEVLSSDLIKEAMAIAWQRWEGERFYTYVNPDKIESSNPGFCFLQAGWKKAGSTKNGLLIFEYLPSWGTFSVEKQTLLKSVYGSQKDDEKETAIIGFSDGKIKYLAGKPQMRGCRIMPHDFFTKTTNPKTIIAADLFCGAGGSSTGLMNAVKELGYDLELLAVNHWDIAIATHSTNHSKVRHLCQSIDTINPQDVIPGKRLNLLLASPECTDHSNAKGGKPRNDQKRADAWLLMRWIEKLYVENLIIENVKEFVNWGPLNAKGLPDKRHRGKYFRQFIEALEINYRVEWRILNCADYGDATTRERFFLIARRNGKKITFPEPTHASRKIIEKHTSAPGLFSDKSLLKPWRPAREIIDWDLKGESIFNRKKPLSENTMRRIFAGLFKYSLKPYLVNMKGTTRRMRDVDEPSFTQTAGSSCQYLAEPFLVEFFGEKEGQKPRISDIEKPLWTVTGQGRMGLEPFLVNLSHTKNNDKSMCKDLENPLNVICGKAMLGLIEPFLVKFYGGADATSVDNPIPTITANYEHYGLAEPFLVSYHSGQKDGGVNRIHSKDEPVPTLDTSNRFAVAEPFLMQYYGSSEATEVDKPLPTVTTKDRFGVVEPFLVKFKNNQDGQSIDEPLQTLTTKDCYGLCIPQLGAIIDIRFRMLQPHELSAAMGFPKEYHFVGTRHQKVRQIGNAVPVNTAKALCKAVLSK